MRELRPFFRLLGGGVARAGTSRNNDNTNAGTDNHFPDDAASARHARTGTSTSARTGMAATCGTAGHRGADSRTRLAVGQWSNTGARRAPAAPAAPTPAGASAAATATTRTHQPQWLAATAMACVAAANPRHRR